jgi:hypothetical protein
MPDKATGAEWMESPPLTALQPAIRAALPVREVLPLGVPGATAAGSGYDGG